MKWSAVAVAAALLIVALAWFLGLPHYRPGLRRGESYGVDVSHHQGTINWAAVEADNITFAYLKASEGGDHVDRQFSENSKAAKAAGLQIGAYHFFTFCRSGRDQAANFLAVAPPTSGWLSPAVDVEFGGNCAKRPTEQELVGELTAFTDTVERSWKRPLIVYVLHDLVARYPALGRLNAGVWQRHLFTRPNNNRWAIWQVSGWANVHGIRGKADLNVGKLSSLGQN